MEYPTRHDFFCHLGLIFRDASSSVDSQIWQKNFKRYHLTLYCSCPFFQSKIILAEGALFLINKHKSSLIIYGPICNIFVVKLFLQEHMIFPVAAQ